MKTLKKDHYAEIRDLSHDGLGVATVQGKTVFIEGALPKEQVHFIYLKKKSKYDIGRVTEILTPAENRTKAPCPYFQYCGGCALQHMTQHAQIEMKQKLLLKQLKHFGLATPEKILDPLLGLNYQYRRRVRLGAQYNQQNKKIELGFKKKNSHILIPIYQCDILEPPLSNLISALQTITNQLENPKSISEVEMAKGDNGIAVLIRFQRLLSNKDKNLLIEFAAEKEIILYSQNQCSYPVQLLWQPQKFDNLKLNYKLPNFNLTLQFHPLDFIQVNADINQKMISRVIELFRPTPADQILDLFCGLGNFTLPLAKSAGQVVGVEGSANLVARGYENAKFNNICNIEFIQSNLNKPQLKEYWASQKYSKLLLDPPRSGALELMKFIPQLAIPSILYISCDPATLARDVGVLIQKGYQLKSVGVMDMFPQTIHVESIALLQLK